LLPGGHDGEHNRAQDRAKKPGLHIADYTGIVTSPVFIGG